MHDNLLIIMSLDFNKSSIKKALTAKNYNNIFKLIQYNVVLVITNKYLF